MIEKLESPFKIVCKNGLKSSKPFNFLNMIDINRTYYYLNSRFCCKVKFIVYILIQKDIISI